MFSCCFSVPNSLNLKTLAQFAALNKHLALFFSIFSFVLVIFFSIFLHILLFTASTSLYIYLFVFFSPCPGSAVSALSIIHNWLFSSFDYSHIRRVRQAAMTSLVAPETRQEAGHQGLLDCTKCNKKGGLESQPRVNQSCHGICNMSLNES